jgi:hypothetical protein
MPVQGANSWEDATGKDKRAVRLACEPASTPLRCRKAMQLLGLLGVRGSVLDHRIKAA